jgi:hypothetical protein
MANENNKQKKKRGGNIDYWSVAFVLVPPLVVASLAAYIHNHPNELETPAEKWFTQCINKNLLQADIGEGVRAETTFKASDTGWLTTFTVLTANGKTERVTARWKAQKLEMLSQKEELLSPRSRAELERIARPCLTKQPAL